MTKKDKNPDGDFLNSLRNYSRINFGVSLVKDSEMQELNSFYRGKDYPTDVLSFGAGEEIDGETFHLGEIAVNVDQAERQAKEYGNDLEQEIAELVEHGTLHLLGIHHDGDD